MNLSLTASTVDGNSVDIKGIKEFSGKNAGICYGSNGYYGTAVTDPEKAYKRFGTVAATGHHSVADHVYVTVLLEDTPKMLLMLLNSLGVYATSEKSGRYTKMTGCSEKEVGLYNKWMTIFDNLIGSKYPQLAARRRLNLAKENARYLLSIFTPACMSYTASIRQWNYIIDWCDGFASSSLSENYFNNTLKACVQELSNWLKDNLYIEELSDNKHRSFDFLAVQTGSMWADFKPNDIYYGNTYQTMYDVSLVSLAHLIRHRTLKYYMLFDGDVRNYYVPAIIKNTDYEREWLADLESVEQYIPGATLVSVVETGTLDNFILKCEERLCGRAMKETCDNVNDVLQDMICHGVSGRFTRRAREKLYSLQGEHTSKTKCQLLGGCKEPCEFPCEACFKRLV